MTRAWRPKRNPAEFRKLRARYAGQDGAIVEVTLTLDAPVSVPSLFALNRRRRDRRERATIRAIERRLRERRQGE